MKYGNSFFFGGMLMFFVLNANWLFAEETTPQQFEGFNLQGYTERGEKSWDVMGETADIVGNLVTMTNIIANSYGEQKVNLKSKIGTIQKDTGKIHLEKDVVITTETGAQLTTETLDWDRNNDLVTTNDFVTIINKNMKATGTGIEAHPNLKLAQLNEDVTVHMKPEKGKPEDRQPVTITCDGPLEIDQLNNLATFNENVVAIQTDRQLKADKMEVYIDPATNKIKKMICTGHVEVTQGENKSYSDMAVYTADDQKLVLTGRPKLILMMEADEEGEEVISMEEVLQP